jgi:hypothetical protein
MDCPSERSQLERYLPLAMVTTAAVVAVPVALAALVVHSHNPLTALAATTLAMGMSVALTSVGAAAWKRWPGSRDLMFADLMLWRWGRRYWTERRLGRARTLYESARRAGPSVSIELIERLSSALETRDASTLGHSQRVARHAGRIAQTMRLAATESAKVRTAAAVHDVGKLYTPRAILNNPGALTTEEYRVLKRHPVDGADMLADVGDPDIAAMVRYHHERLDGSGYPDGLVGEEIPLGARIIAVADTFDAISSERVYRSARTHKKALDILSMEAGLRLDAAVVAAFVQSYAARRPVAGLSFASGASQRALAWLQASSTSIALSTAGIAPLVPAVGAAGVLALSHGAHHGALAARRRGTQAAAPLTSTLSALSTTASAQGKTSVRIGVDRLVLGRPPAARRGSPFSPTATNTPTRAGATPLLAPTAQAGSDAPQAPAASGPPASTGDPNTASSGQSATTTPAGAPPDATPSATEPALTVITASTPTLAVPAEEVSAVTPAIDVTVTTPSINIPSVKLP